MKCMCVCLHTCMRCICVFIWVCTEARGECWVSSLCLPSCLLPGDRFSHWTRSSLLFSSLPFSAHSRAGVTGVHGQVWLFYLGAEVRTQVLTAAGTLLAAEPHETQNSTLFSLNLGSVRHTNTAAISLRNSPTVLRDVFNCRSTIWKSIYKIGVVGSFMVTEHALLD